MNERIRELAQEVFSFKYKSNPNELNPDHNMDHIHKFAELIVEECAQRAEAYAYTSQNFNALAEELRRMIGVKE